MSIIIDFEGLDGSYKETNALRLKKYIKDHICDNNIDIVYESFPRYTNNGSYFIKQYLKGKYNYIPFKVVSQLFLLDMMDWWKTHKKDNTIYILDRFYFSMLYYLTPLKNDLSIKKLDKTINVIHDVYGLPKVNIVIKMNNSLENMITVLKNKKNADMYEKDIEYLINVRKRYNKFNFNKYIDTRNIHGVLNIDVVNKDEEEVFNEILDNDIIKSIMNKE